MSLANDLQILMNHKSPPPAQSDTAMRRGTIIHKMMLEHGINPFAMYCTITGEEMGELNHSQIQLVWSAIDMTDSDDVIIDELWARVISSMRPSSMELHQARNHRPFATHCTFASLWLSTRTLLHAA